MPDLIEGDAVRLRQVLINLVSNAVKFTDQGEVNVRVRMKDVPEDGEGEWFVYFEVQDTGIGIPEDKRHVIFDSFTQADASTTRKFGGTGLGLTICKRLVELMGGQIGVESEIGKGSSFYFTIRTSKRDASAVFEPIAELSSSFSLTTREGQDREGRIRILIAEDNPINQRVALKYLERLGYTADVVANGIEALEAVSATTYDLVLMDVHMPVMDGLTATQEICNSKTILKKPYIVALTASVMEKEQEACFQAGMDAFLQKPINVEALVKVLNAVPFGQEQQASSPYSSVSKR